MTPQFESDPDIARLRTLRNTLATTTRGRGRPSEGVRVDIRIPADMLAEVDRYALAWKMTRASTLRRLILFGLEVKDR